MDKHRFKWPNDAELQRMRLSEKQLQWFLSGFDVIGNQPLHYPPSYPSN
ncbi:MAG TPA: hypothetical protein DCW59_16170 [Alteromonas sp.]|nr:hypothetical protein [Alteromonas sp.]